MNGLLECLVLERFQTPATVTHQMVMVAVALRLVARDAVADVHAAEQVQVHELVDDAVDRGTADPPAVALAQPVLDVQRAERARLLVEELDHRFASAAAPV